MEFANIINGRLVYDSGEADSTVFAGLVAYKILYVYSGHTSPNYGPLFAISYSMVELYPLHIAMYSYTFLTSRNHSLLNN